MKASCKPRWPTADEPGVDGVYTDAVGTLDDKLYLSATLGQRPALVVMLHGASQTASDFAAGTRMQELTEDCGGIALFPQQSRPAHPLGSWNWYDTRHQVAQGGEPALIVGLTRQIAAAHGVDQRRICVAGMSSGIALGAANDLMSALRTINNGPAQAWPGQPEPFHRMPGSYTDTSGPDASREMLRFFLAQRLARGRLNDRA